MMPNEYEWHAIDGHWVNTKPMPKVSKIERKLRRQEIKRLDNRIKFSKGFLTKETIDKIEARLEWLELNWNEAYDESKEVYEADLYELNNHRSKK